MGEGLLEVTVRHVRDVPGACEGGADRLHVAALGSTRSVSPTPAAVSAVCRESVVPVFVLLRLDEGRGVTDEGLDRLARLAEDFLGVGAAGLAWGFLDADLEVDTRACARLAERLASVPWTLHGVLDDTLDPRRSWRRVRDLPGLVAVRSAGSPRGLAVGYEDLLEVVRSDPDAARLLLPGGALVAEQVPWLVRAGVHRLHLGVQARPGATYRSHVDAGHVRSWRLLLDDAVRRA